MKKEDAEAAGDVMMRDLRLRQERTKRAHELRGHYVARRMPSFIFAGAALGAAAGYLLLHTGNAAMIMGACLGGLLGVGCAVFAARRVAP